jgi:hypothetical protein
MNASMAVRFGEKMPTTRSYEGGEGMESDHELMLEDARSIREGLWRMARYAQDAAELADYRIDAEALDGATEAAELRETLEQVQNLSLRSAGNLTPTRIGTLLSLRFNARLGRWLGADARRGSAAGVCD